MCVGRYAAKVMRNERSEMEHNRSEMPANIAEQTRIPRDAISPPKGNLMLSHSAGMHNIGISIAGISKRFHFASLHYIFSAYLPTHIKFLTEFLILRYAMGQKKSPAWWVPHRRRYLMRWLGGFITAPNFYILFLVTCQDNVNQSGNIGYVHYAVGVDVASSVRVS